MAADEPSVRIAGATAEGLKFTTNDAAFRRSLIIEPVAAKEAKQLSIELPDLVGPDSKPVTTKWTLDGRKDATAVTTITPPHAARLDVEADLPTAGEYASWITLIFDGARVSTTALKVTRAALAPTVRVLGPTSVTYEGLLAGTPVVKFVLQETAGTKVTLRPPVATGLARKDGDRTLQAGYDRIEFWQVEPNGSSKRIVDGFELKANQSVPVLMKVPGMSDPGEFTGGVTIGSEAGGALPDQAFTIFVKRPWWVALAIIAAGVFVSYWLRRWAKMDRPRLIQQRRVLQLEGDLEALSENLPDKADQDVLQVLRERLQKVYEEIGLGFGDKADDILKDVNGKLSIVPLWSSVRRRVQALAPELARDLQALLRLAKEFLENRQPGDGEQIRQKLSDAATTINQKIRDAMQAGIAAAVKQAKEYAVDLAEPRKAEFDANVMQRLAQADKAAQENPPAEAQARALLEDAWKGYADILARDLEEKSARLKKPDGMERSEWDSLTEKISVANEAARSAADAATAKAAAEKSYAAYLWLLVRIAQTDASRLEQEAQRDAAKYAEEIEALGRAQGSLTEASIRVKNIELRAAKEAYDAARKEIDTAAGKLPGTKRESIQAVRPELAAPAGIVPIPELRRSLESADRHERAWLDLRAIEQKINGRDGWIALIVAIIAIVLGVFLLWIGNLTWGSGKDMLAAFLWGLGLHQAAGNAIGAKLDLGALGEQVTGGK